MDKKTIAIISLQHLAMEQTGNHPELHERVISALLQGGDKGCDSPDAREGGGNVISASNVRSSGTMGVRCVWMVMVAVQPTLLQQCLE